MKKNNKGFMLAELIITATIVISTMVALYANFNKLYNLYQTKNNYYSIDGLYATKEMTKTLLENDFNKFLNEYLDTNHTKYIISNSECNFTNTDNNKKTCESIKNLYHIKNMVISEYDKCMIGSKKCSQKPTDALEVNNETFKEYIEYVVNYYNIEESEDYQYIILTEIEEEGKNYYSNLRIR